MDRTHPTDEEQTEREWYLWLGAILVVGVGLLVVFPSLWPELAVVIVVAVAFIWLYKTLIESGE